MSGDEIPTHVQRFIVEQVRSVVELELLLLMQAAPDRAWTAAELAGELRVAQAWAERELDDLTQRGIVVSGPGPDRNFRYQPRSREIDATIRELARVYSERRVTVTQMIFTAPADPIQIFSDAFRLRKDESDG